jgi:hypothetical protein
MGNLSLREEPYNAGQFFLSSYSNPHNELLHISSQEYFGYTSLYYQFTSTCGNTDKSLPGEFSPINPSAFGQGSLINFTTD